MDDFGYHAGDLGKAEYRKEFKHGGRNTGHFGTGVYFVGNPNQFSGSYKKRPIQKINFSKYKDKLFRPKNGDSSYDLHQALAELNNHPDNVMNLAAQKAYDIKNKMTSQFSENDYYDGNNSFVLDDLNFLAKFVGADPFIGTKYQYSGKQRPYMRKGDPEYDRARDLLYQLSKQDLEFLRQIDSAEIARKKLKSLENLQNIEQRLFSPTNYEKNPLDKLRDYYNSNKNDFYNPKNDDEDSLSTTFMKMAGYNGVDNRGFYQTDNTGYGSVIYDLDDEDSALRDKLMAQYLYGRKFR